MNTSTETTTARTEPTDPRLPKDATPIGYDFDTAFYESEEKNLVYVVQGGLVLALPRVKAAPKGERS